jgi:hypothetical protein
MTGRCATCRHLKPAEPAQPDYRVASDPGKFQWVAGRPAEPAWCGLLFGAMDQVVVREGLPAQVRADSYRHDAWLEVSDPDAFGCTLWEPVP